MTGYTYVHVWPILDTSRPYSALIAEACRDLDICAQLAGARLTGQPAWHVTDDNKLVCKVPATPLNPNLDVEERDAQPARPSWALAPEVVATIQQMARRGASVAAIARAVGCKWETAKKYARAAA